MPSMSPSATPATQSEGRCREVPRLSLPCKVKVGVAKCHACHANGGGDHGAQRGPSAPPEPAQYDKCHACHAECTSMSPSAVRVSKLCGDMWGQVVCVRKAAGAGGSGSGEAEVHNQKQEPHTKIQRCGEKWKNIRRQSAILDLHVTSVWNWCWSLGPVGCEANHMQTQEMPKLCPKPPKTEQPKNAKNKTTYQ